MKKKTIIIVIGITALILGFYLYTKFSNNSYGKNSINNINVDSKHLNEVLKIIGVTKSKNNCHSCLNYYLSDDNYSKNAQDIISYYKDAYESKILKYPPDYVFNSEECGFGLADCYSISKIDAQYLYDLYNFEGAIENYFDKSNLLKDDYIFFYNHSLGECEYDIVHSLTSEYVNINDIQITDFQSIKGSNKLSDEFDYTVYKKVTYNFKKRYNGSYYLDNVYVN